MECLLYAVVYVACELLVRLLTQAFKACLAYTAGGPVQK